MRGAVVGGVMGGVVLPFVDPCLGELKDLNESSRENVDVHF